MRPAEADIGMSSTGPKLAGSQPVAKPLATMVNTMMTHFITRDIPAANGSIDLNCRSRKVGSEWIIYCERTHRNHLDGTSGRFRLVDITRRPGKVFAYELHVFAQHVELLRVRAWYLVGYHRLLDLRQPFNKRRPLFR